MVFFESCPAPLFSDLAPSQTAVVEWRTGQQKVFCGRRAVVSAPAMSLRPLFFTVPSRLGLFLHPFSCFLPESKPLSSRLSIPDRSFGRPAQVYRAPEKPVSPSLASTYIPLSSSPNFLPRVARCFQRSCLFMSRL